MKRSIIIAVVVLALVGLGVYLSNKDSKPVVTNDFAHVPDPGELQANMQKAGLQPLTAEGTVHHIHQHLDIIVNGKQESIPADIGMAQTFISALHTHDGTGVLHLESPVKKDFTLGQFFDEWGVTLNDNCIGTFCADNDHKMIVAVNGSIIQHPHDYVLKAHDEIEIWYGPKSENPNWIKSFNFTDGL